jgi:hypothetical protein
MICKDRHTWINHRCEYCATFTRRECVLCWKDERLVDREEMIKHWRGDCRDLPPSLIGGRNSQNADTFPSREES